MVFPLIKDIDIMESVVKLGESNVGGNCSPENENCKGIGQTCKQVKAKRTTFPSQFVISPFPRK